MEAVIKATPDVGHATTWGAGLLATAGGVGWLSTENLAWLIPMGIAAAISIYNAYLNARFRLWQLKLEAEVAKARTRKAIRETGETAIPHGLEPHDVPDSVI